MLWYTDAARGRTNHHMMIDIAIGRTCHFCGAQQTTNERLRRESNGAVETLTAPLCPRHLLLLRSAGADGRFHKPTSTRWWLVAAGTDQPVPAGAACPAESLLQNPNRPAGRGGR
jgi:hypothetical protein